MKQTKIFLLTFLLLSSFGIGFGQNCGYVAGHTCSTAPVICDLNCLDQFTGTLLDTSDIIIKQNKQYQPKYLCTTGGDPDNLSWFAFIAGSNFAKITISPFGCAFNRGIQAGMFGDCDFSDDQNINNTPIASEFIDCDIFLPFNSDIVLESSSLIPGQTYYFYVDGNGGDICSYKVSVDGKTKQAGEIPNLLTFDQGKNKDTIALCPSTKYELGVDSYKLDIKYYWKVAPVNSKYAAFSKFTPLDKRSLDFSFDSLGTYTVSLYAYNGCDATDTLERTFVVKQYTNEKFSDVTICENSFPFAGPQTEDPNKDGILGWQGPNILAEGISKYMVMLASGCKYEQEVNVKTHKLQAREKIVLADCIPFQYYNVPIIDNIFNEPVTIPNADKNGCDSLVELNAYILDVTGSIVQKNCNQGEVELQFNVANISSPTGYLLKYFWKDELNKVIVDNDTDPTNIKVNSKKTVFLDIELSVLGKKCSFTIPSIAIDPSTQLPLAPLAQNWDLEVCDGTALVNFAVTQQSTNTYTWTVGSPFKIIGSATGTNVNIDCSGGVAPNKILVCVIAENGCGIGPKTCQDITILKTPTIDFTQTQFSICKDSVLTVIHPNSNNNYLYKWDFGTAQLISGNTTKAGPIKIKYNAEGNFDIKLLIENKECSSTQGDLKVEVIKSVTQSSITSIAYANKIDIEWTSVPCAKSYELFIDNVSKGIFTNEFKYELANLKPGEKYKAQIEVLGDAVCGCGISKVESEVSTLSCSEQKLSISPVTNIICEDNWPNQVNLMANFTNLNNQNFVWQGNGVSSNGVFSPIALGVGKHKVKISIEDLGCIYSDSITFNLIKKPDFNMKPQDPACADETEGSVEILPNDPLAILNMFVDGNKISSNFIDNLAIGTHQIEVIDANLCKVVKTFTINKPVFPDVSITGNEGSIYDNQQVELVLTDKNNELNLIDSVVWSINGEVYCKGSCRNLNFTSMEGGEYIHQILIYYKDCVLEKSLNFVVKESPKVYTSNIFNPNSTSELNKYLSIKSNDGELKIKDLNIYSRWGELVFTKSDFNVNGTEQLWDGSFNGKQLEEGVYVMRITYINEKGILIVMNKDITIVK